MALRYWKRFSHALSGVVETAYLFIPVSPSRLYGRRKTSFLWIWPTQGLSSTKGWSWKRRVDAAHQNNFSGQLLIFFDCAGVSWPTQLSRPVGEPTDLTRVSSVLKPLGEFVLVVFTHKLEPHHGKNIDWHIGVSALNRLLVIPLSWRNMGSNGIYLLLRSNVLWRYVPILEVWGIPRSKGLSLKLSVSMFLPISMKETPPSSLATNRF